MYSVLHALTLSAAFLVSVVLQGGLMPETQLSAMQQILHSICTALVQALAFPALYCYELLAEGNSKALQWVVLGLNSGVYGVALAYGVRWWKRRLCQS